MEDWLPLPLCMTFIQGILPSVSRFSRFCDVLIGQASMGSNSLLVFKYEVLLPIYQILFSMSCQRVLKSSSLNVNANTVLTQVTYGV